MSRQPAPTVEDEFEGDDGNAMTSNALGALFEKAVKHHDVPLHHGEKLTFRCLRRYANEELVRARLELPEREIMLGHGPKAINMSTYTDREKESFLEIIQDKLDIYKLGMTFEEHLKANEVSSWQEVLDGNDFIPVSKTMQERWNKRPRYGLLELGNSDIRNIDQTDNQLGKILQQRAKHVKRVKDELS